MHPLTPLVVFNLDDRRYGLPLPAVERVVRMVDVTPLSKAPDIVSGVLSVRGARPMLRNAGQAEYRPAGRKSGHSTLAIGPH